MSNAVNKQVSKPYKSLRRNHVQYNQYKNCKRYRCEYTKILILTNNSIYKKKKDSNSGLVSCKT